MSGLSSSLLSLLLLASNLALLYLYWELYRKYVEVKKKVKSTDFDQIQKQTRSILSKALTKAHSIITRAQQEGSDIIHETESTTKTLAQHYQEELDQITKNLEAQITQEVQKAESDFAKYLGSLKSHADASTGQVHKYVQTRADQTFTSLDQQLAETVKQLHIRSATAIEEELKKARQAVETYKAEQTRVVDNNIVAILEKTLNLVLTKKLTLKDHMDLVYEALEKAKVEKMIS